MQMFPRTNELTNIIFRMSVKQIYSEVNEQKWGRGESNGFLVQFAEIWKGGALPKFV